MANEQRRPLTRKQITAAAWKAYTDFKAGRSLSKMNDADLEQALKLHAAYTDEVATLRVRVNVDLVQRAIDYCGDRMELNEGGTITFGLTYLEGKVDALETFAGYIRELGWVNLEHHDSFNEDSGTPFAQQRLERSIDAANRQAQLIDDAVGTYYDR